MLESSFQIILLFSNALTESHAAYRIGLSEPALPAYR